MTTSSVKYILFDLAVALAIIASIAWASRGALGDLLSRTTNNSSSGGGGATRGHDCRDADGDTSKIELAFHVGDIVEVHEPKIHPSYAFLAQVESVHVSDKCSDNNRDGGDSSIRYDVLLGFGGDRYTNIDSSSLAPMRPFAPNTRAMCENGPTLNARMTPCVINRVVETPSRRFFGGDQDGEHPWLYSVSLRDEGAGEDTSRDMPVSRIRRIVAQDQEEEASEVSRMAKAVPSPANTPVHGPVMLSNTAQANDESQDDSRDDPFKVGNVIELYGPGAIFAFPATVTGVTRPADSSVEVKFDLQHGTTHVNLKSIDPQFVHPYVTYAEGTVASCNVGKMRKVIMVPCTVVSSALDPRREGDVVYQVRAKMIRSDGTMEEGDEKMLFLPRLRVQRRIDRTAEGR